MDSIIKFASGFSTIENYAHDVYIKSNLTIELDKIINRLVEENPHRSENEYQIVFETPTVKLLCDIIEAIFLHGLKEKLSTTVSNVLNMKPRVKNLFCLDFWPVIEIFSHNQESEELNELFNISTDIGRCRAWLRITLGQCLLRSYFNSLICESSSLNSFYKSSAYLRDAQHTDMMKNLLSKLDYYVFHFNINNSALNTWSSNTLDFLGISFTSEDSFMVATALDAMHLINDNRITTSGKKKIKNYMYFDDENQNINQENSSPVKNDKPIKKMFVPDFYDQGTSTITLDQQEILKNNIEIDDPYEIKKSENNSCTGNSLMVKSGWSTEPIILEENYNALLESYSARAIFSSTPEGSDISNSIKLSRSDETIDSSESDFEIIPKICDDDTENRKFFEQTKKLANEFGLDEQDYKCYLCSRPIGMIYGQCTLCHIDGHLYCLDCHGGEEIMVPAQIIYNWSFKKFPVAKQNKDRLAMIENEPIFDLKILSPSLYSSIPEMAEILNLRTQLFFLHAYLFTCQENIALKMRKLVWPREHLFEHIHLYSFYDLQQIQNNVLATTLQQVITFARKHISGCNLCKLKGFYCEICKNSEILYPFDTNSTKRCVKCKSVFHIKCYDEMYEKNNCPKCLRIAKKREPYMCAITF